MNHVRISIILAIGTLLAAGCASRPVLFTAQYADEVEGDASFCEWFLNASGRLYGDRGFEHYRTTLAASNERGELLLRTVDGSAEWSYEIIDRVRTDRGVVAVRYQEGFAPIILYELRDDEAVAWWSRVGDVLRDAHAIWPRLTDRTFAMSPGGLLVALPQHGICVQVAEDHPSAERLFETNTDPVLKYVLPAPVVEVDLVAAFQAGADVSLVRSLRDIDPFGVLVREALRMDAAATIAAAMSDPAHVIWDEWRLIAEDLDEFETRSPAPYVERVERLHHRAIQRAR